MSGRRISMLATSLLFLLLSWQPASAAIINEVYYRQDFGNVKTLLQEVEYDDVFYALDSKSLLLKNVRS